MSSRVVLPFRHEEVAIGIEYSTDPAAVLVHEQQRYFSETYSTCRNNVKKLGYAAEQIIHVESDVKKHTNES